jgi:hypothetical protein
MTDEPDRHAEARYRQLLARTYTDLKLAEDVAVALNLPYKRRARLQRARRELGDEQRETETQRSGGDDR